ncbi:SusD/RagB family nutrient-binding outer membrane lipoprotein [Hymenobacter agri]
MKLFSKALAAAALCSVATGCSSYLDVNVNPNSPTISTADGILAQALSTTAANYSGNTPSYNSYAMFAAGYIAKSGTVNGYTEERTYNYTSSFYSGLFDNTYDNLLDYDLVQQQKANFPYQAAIARIMKAYNFQLLVDQYGDIPYTNALKGLNNVTPTYDKAADIYKDLIVQLDGAIADIKAANNTLNVRPISTTSSSEDVVFRGNMTSWIRFANSLKLRILLRESQVPSLSSYVATEMARLQANTDGYITTDVEVQPGYLQTSGKQNPLYNRYGVTSAGLAATERNYQLPTNYATNLYNANHDPRGQRMYSLVSGKYVAVDAGERNPVLGNAGSRFRLNGGILKGYDAPISLMLLADHLFAKAEAETRGLFAGGDAAAKTDYLAGVTASFVYTYRVAPSLRQTTLDSSAFVTTANIAGNRLGSGKVARYLAANVGNPLVDFDKANVNGALGKQEIIIFQKYLANNVVGAVEAWDDYRRTGLPKIKVSLESSLSTVDKFPTRLLYPLSEVTTNGSNVPAGTSQTTKIFWDVVD